MRKHGRAKDIELNFLHRASRDVDTHRSNVDKNIHVDAISGKQTRKYERTLQTPRFVNDEVFPKYSVDKRMIIPKLMKNKSSNDEHIM